MCPDQKPIADLGLAVCNFGKPGPKARRQGNVRKVSNSEVELADADFRFTPDSVAKVPKRRATKFPLNDKASGNRRSM
jgi:hypothetical protein